MEKGGDVEVSHVRVEVRDELGGAPEDAVRLGGGEIAEGHPVGRRGVGGGSNKRRREGVRGDGRGYLMTNKKGLQQEGSATHGLLRQLTSGSTRTGGSYRMRGC